MSRPKIPVMPRENAGHSMEGCASKLPTDRIPTETCWRCRTSITSVKVNHIHSVSSLGEHLDDKILVFLLPSSHDRLLIRVNDRSDIACNIFLLSALLMKGHPERGKRHNGIPYIDFRAACNAYVKVWKAKIDKLLQELKDAFAR